MKPSAGLAGVRRRLGRDELAGVLVERDDVGERAAGVDADPDPSLSVRHVVDSTGRAAVRFVVSLCRRGAGRPANLATLAESGPIRSGGSTPNTGVTACRGSSVPGSPRGCRARGGRVSTRRGAHPPVHRQLRVRRRGGRCHRGRVFGDAAAYERFMGRWSVRLAPRVPRRRSGCRIRAGRARPRLAARATSTRAVAAALAGLRGRGRRPVGAVRRGSTRAGRRPRVPRALRGGTSAERRCRSTTARSTPRWRSSSSTSCPTPTGRSPQTAPRRPRPGESWRPRCGTTAGGWRCSARLWDAAARLDPSVVGQDEATMPVGRPGGLPTVAALRPRASAAPGDGDTGFETSTTTGSRSWRAGPAGLSRAPDAAPPPCATRSRDLGPGR